ncbi:dienelactone hydrolase [Coprinopsis sp. MPI-PUGE-AT-0042]|nr:dienelactone hydrolase [Coprinopsis sp. MPI-PUGE-AT-0042]
MSLRVDCVRGVQHEGTPTGSIEEIGGVPAYVATPGGDYAKDTVILFLTDVFGYKLINSQLLADDFSRNGYKVVVPDYLNNDPRPAEAMDQPEEETVVPFTKWLKEHDESQTRPVLDKVIAALKEQGVTKFGATGYCFGGRYVFDLAFENIIKVGVANHPSFLKMPEDAERYVATSKAPLLVNTCPVDNMFPQESQIQADKVFEGFEHGYKRNDFEGCIHGFAVRGDLSNPKVKAGKEGAFEGAVDWFKRHL